MADKLNLRQKLASVYKNIEFIEKAGDNSSQHYKYVRAADVLRAIRKAFADVGVYAQTNFELLGTYDIPTNRGGNMHTATVKATITFFDLDSDETKTVSGLGDGADSGDKGIYKAQTGAVKNALRNAFLVPDEADPEADASVDEATSEPAAKPLPAKPRVREHWEAEDNQQAQSKVAENAQEPRQSHHCLQTKPANKGPLPDDKQLEEYGKKLAALTEKLQKEGGLKQSRGLHVKRKVFNYLKFVTSQEEFKDISIAQYETFFEFAGKIEPAALTKLIENSLKGEK